MKKRILISSVLTIVLCFSLIVGSTFALFTDKDEFDISVTAGKVAFNASASISGVYSALSSSVADDQYLVDPTYGNFTHELQKDAAGNLVNTFANGGYAVYNEGKLTITNITPGDRVDLAIDFANASNVAVQYRVVFKTNNGELANATIVTIDDVEYRGDNVLTDWTELDANEVLERTINVSVELPVYVGNDYQEDSVSYTILVEAVQANGR